jgi:hypothetical protein
VLHELVDNGNTVLVIEHNLDVIKTADWIWISVPKAAMAAARWSRRHAGRRGQGQGKLDTGRYALAEAAEAPAAKAS